MIDVSEIITDPDLAQNFTVYRKSGEFAEGGYIQGEETAIPMTGVVIPSTPDDLLMVPEGDRITAGQTFYSTEEICRTREGGTSDEILWNGNRYRVMHVWDRTGDGGYYKAVAEKMAGY